MRTSHSVYSAHRMLAEGEVAYPILLYLHSSLDCSRPGIAVVGTFLGVAAAHFCYSTLATHQVVEAVEEAGSAFGASCVG